MPVTFYMDVHVPQAITDQLRHRRVDVLTAIEDGCQRRTDEEVLDRAGQLGRVVFTQDIRLLALAERYQRGGTVVFRPRLRAPAGRDDRAVRKGLGTHRESL